MAVRVQKPVSGPIMIGPGPERAMLIHIPLLASVGGCGRVDIVVSAGQKPSNPVQVSFQ
jgi:hypothetical protein